MISLPNPLMGMGEYRQFILYKLVDSNKYPCDFRTGNIANAHDSSIWTDYKTAIASSAQYGGNYGVGFTFTENDPFFFLDIDNALLETNEWSDLAKQLCAIFNGAAIEVSSSGKGLHIFGKGHVPEHNCKNTELGIEFYSKDRFVALTGINIVGDVNKDCSDILPWLVETYFKKVFTSQDVWTIAPCKEWSGPIDDDELIKRALKSKSARSTFLNKASFSDIWNCNVDILTKTYPASSANSSTPYDASSVDAALAQMLMFWTGKDCQRVERLMLKSNLRRKKWDREDYLKTTITHAYGRQTDVLKDKPLEKSDLQTSQKPKLVTNSTFLTIQQQIEHFSGCVYIVDMHRVLIPGGACVKDSQFKVLYGGYSMSMDNANEKVTKDAWEAFTQSQALRPPVADRLCFRPDLKPGEIVNIEGTTFANIYWPVEVDRKVGDPTPFLNFLQKLLPNERDRTILLSYMAAIVQYKGVKFQWAPVLQGCEGNGKTFITRAVAAAVGNRYSYFPSAMDITDKFNDWMLNNIFIAVQDIYVSGDRGEVLESLKPMVTDREHQIQGKNKDKFKGDICANWILNSNHRNAIPVNDKSRRYAYLYTAQQEYEDLARDGMDGSYFKNLYDWAKADGFAIISELLYTYMIPDEFNPATSCTRAPTTSSTKQAIAESMGVVEQEILEAVDQSLPGFSGGWISSIAFDKLLEKVGIRSRISRIKKNEILKGLGYIPHPSLKDGRSPHTVLPDCGKPRLFIKKDSPHINLTTVESVIYTYTNLQNVIDETVNTTYIDR